MWVEKKFEEDPITAVKLALSSHSTGQLVIHFSEGTPRAVVWREKVTTHSQKVLDRVSESNAILAP